jgi:hypothetical protein
MTPGDRMAPNIGGPYGQQPPLDRSAGGSLFRGQIEGGPGSGISGVMETARAPLFRRRDQTVFQMNSVGSAHSYFATDAFEMACQFARHQSSLVSNCVGRCSVFISPGLFAKSKHISVVA